VDQPLDPSADGARPGRTQLAPKGFAPVDDLTEPGGARRSWKKSVPTRSGTKSSFLKSLKAGFKRDLELLLRNAEESLEES
jgi:hypothetical protein